MHMDSRSSHPRILRGPASEVVLTNQPQGASLASLARLSSSWQGLVLRPDSWQQGITNREYI